MTRQRPRWWTPKEDTFVTDQGQGRQAMQTITEQAFLRPIGASECQLPYAHPQSCGCISRGLPDHAHRVGSLTLSHSQSQQLPVSSTAAAEGHSGWWNPRQSLPGYAPCQYGPLSSTDSTFAGVSASIGNTPLSYQPVTNACPQNLTSSTSFGTRPSSQSFGEHFALQPAYGMQDMKAQVGSSAVDQSPSPVGSGSDETASPPLPTVSSSGNNRQEYGPHRASDPKIKFPDIEQLKSLECNGEDVKADIDARIEKNLFYEDQNWTCYRRNYISVQCHYTLTPCMPGVPLYVEEKGKQFMVQALGVSLSAAMDQPEGKGIGLVKHTPKRDRGPQTEVGVEKLLPVPTGTVGPPFHPASSANGPYLPLQAAVDSNSPEDSRSADDQRGSGMSATGQHTFERIQFKQATANNGRRRAAQQFYHLMVELHADIRKHPESAPKWIKIAHRISEKMVVRGRSPGHYKDPPSSSGAPSGSSGGASGRSYNGFGYGSGSSGPSSYRYSLSSHAGSASSSSDAYRGHQSAIDGTDASHSAGISDPHCGTAMTEQEAHDFTNAVGYRYYPAAMYDADLGQPRQSVKMESYQAALNQGSGPEGFGVNRTGSNWPVMSCGRFQGLETSRGLYSDLGATY